MTLFLNTHLVLSNCPLCGVNSPNLEFVFTSASQDFLGYVCNWAVYRCKKCAGLVTAHGLVYGQEIYGYFPSNSAPLSNDLPERAREYLVQAIASADSPVGAVLLAANSVGAMLQEKGLANGTLNERINRAADSHLITGDMAEWAHKVRLDANEQRHSDLTVQLPASADAKRSIEFALALGEILFVLPARVARGNVLPTS